MDAHQVVLGFVRYSDFVILNGGYAYREQLNSGASGQRALTYLTSHYRHSSQADWGARLARGEVLLDGVPASGAELLRAGQVLVWHRPPWHEAEVPRDYQILFEDEALLAVDKPGGLPTLPGGGFLDHTLLSFVRARFPGASALHRLGRGTSGVVLFARTREAASLLSRSWREHDVEKRYRALASGVAARDAYHIKAPIGPVAHPRLGTVHAVNSAGKASCRAARVLERRELAQGEGATLFQVDIFTGRPHQIRIHLASIGHPLLGDPLYAAGGEPRPELPGLPGDLGYLLHAERLVFTHPLSGERVQVRAPAPPDLRERR